MHEELTATGLWRDTAEMPESLAATLDGAAGFDDVVDLLTRDGVRRVVASGNGASYYVAQALWLATMAGDRCPVEVVAVPGGLLAKGAFRWRDGDVLLAISSSGEFRDVIEAVESADFPRPFALVTATPGSTLGRAADARALVAVPNQRAVTHTQAFCGAVLACLEIWARAVGDRSLSSLVRTAPAVCARAAEATLAWGSAEFPGIDVPTAAIAFGTGSGWAAALENALLVKEVARIPCEGVETREGATAAMTALLPEHLVLSLPTLADPLIEEAEEICRKLGVPVLRAPGGEAVDRRLSPISTFPASVALATELALRAGWNADDPAWIDTYYLTARREADLRVDAVRRLDPPSILTYDPPMTTGDVAFVGSIPGFYDRYLGPLLFEGFADDLAARLPSDRLQVLETACGTGIVTERILGRLPTQATLLATDLNDAMIAHARARIGDDHRLAWRIADATSLPLAEGSFDAVVCQFGVMFFRDKAAGAREALRVLRPGGLYLLSVWDGFPHNPPQRITHETVAGFFPNEPPQFYAVPCGFHDPNLVAAMLAEAGFRAIEWSPVERTGECPTAAAAARGLIEGNPIRDAILARDPAALPEVEAALAASLAAELGDRPLRTPLRALVFSARRPD